MRTQLLSRALLATLFGLSVASIINPPTTTEHKAIDREDASLEVPVTPTIHHRDNISLPTRHGRRRREIDSTRIDAAEHLNPASHQDDGDVEIMEDGSVRITEPACPPHKVCLAPGILAVIVIFSCLGSLLFIGVPIATILLCKAWNAVWDH